VTTDRIGDFEATLGFAPDPFQHAAIRALAAGRSVLVAAPTGAGKTVVGEFCCHDALASGGKTFYTTPIKALSNQKYRDLVDRHGSGKVGLLTGDRSINGEAPVVVMTTEVLRNMLYEASPTLRGLRYVVLDEVHYLADRERGGVWEEVLIQLPASVQVAALSATVSNAEEFGDWLAEVRDGCEVIIEEHRPVPLRHHYWVNDRIYPTFRAGNKGQASRHHREQAAQARAGVPNPDVLMLERNSQRGSRVNQKGRRVRTGPRLRWPSRAEVVEELARKKWLPAIIFVFSRRGCEEAVAELVKSGVRLTTPEERDEIARTVDTLLADLPAADLEALDFATWRAALMDGIAAHHAGMVPAFKECVEVCFQSGWLKVVIATETLALGINMPARTVVIERLEKWNGETHVMLTPGEYTQLTGRAGRRGIDTVGNAVVLYQRGIDFPAVAGLVGTRSYPLRSSFAPSYNMAVNLLRRHDQEQAETLLGASFAQFQADRDTGGLGVRLAEATEGLRGYGQHLTCDRGDWAAYWALRRALSDREKAGARDRRRAAQAAQRDGLANLQPGDVLWLPWLGRRGLAAVVGIQLTSKGVPLAQVVADDRALTRIGPRELDGAPVVVDRIRLPKRGNPRQRDYRGEIASRLRGVAPPEGLDATGATEPDPALQAELADLRAQMEAHPCHRCPDRSDHERWQYRADDLAAEATKLRDRIERRTGSLVRQFHRIVDVLQRLGYLDDQPKPTADGMRLAGIYSQVDLLVAESLGRGLLDGLDSAEVAGVCGLFLYEPRGGEPTFDPRWPTPRLRAACEEIAFLAEELRGVERDAGLTPMGDLDPGFVAPAYRWASGLGLEEAVEGIDITGGDFVRNVKMLADLAGQLRSVGDAELSAAASRAVDGLRRGIVEA
jgi:ATP-dependent RNA helicase HelY